MAEKPGITLFETVDQAAEWIGTVRFLASEFMYRPRPTEPPARLVFDYALAERLRALTPLDAVLFVCDSTATIDSLRPLLEPFPRLHFAAIITNPNPSVMQTDTPKRFGWDGAWQRMEMTDRWSRILTALRIGARLAAPGSVLMPAHDAVYNADLLSRLLRLSETHSKNRLPAAVSPYTYFQHSAVMGADIPPPIIDLINTAFGRDYAFRWKVRFDRVQAFWGKMGLIPFGICAEIIRTADTSIWEDDLELDRVIRTLGYGVRCLWVSAPADYRQALPVFDRVGAKRVIERTLHYSLNIPSKTVGESSLNFPLGPIGKLRQVISPNFRQYNRLAEALIAECNVEISARLAQYRASWVDWGAYRYVMRVGDPSVEVWKPISLHQPTPPQN